MDLVDLILPETDGGVLVQLVAFLLLGAVGFWVTRARREWRLVLIGFVLVGLGFIGLRSLH